MTHGLFKKLTLAAPLVVCLPLCALGADGSAADDSPKIFEQFSLTSAPPHATSPAPCAPSPAPAPYAAAPAAAPCATAPSNCCGNGGCDTGHSLPNLFADG